MPFLNIFDFVWLIVCFIFWFSVTTYAQDSCNVRLTSKIVSFYGFESFQPVETNECEGTCFSQSIQDSCNATILREHCRCCRPDVIVKRFVDFRWINPFFKFPVNSVVAKHFSSLRVNFGVSITKSCRCGPCN